MANFNKAKALKEMIEGIKYMQRRGFDEDEMWDNIHILDYVAYVNPTVEQEFERVKVEAFNKCGYSVEFVIKNWMGR